MTTETFPGASNGACRSMATSIWFPTRGESVDLPKRVCDSCPVVDGCREHGILHEREGVWGSLTGRERRAERRRRGITIDTPGTPGELYGWRTGARVAS